MMIATFAPSLRTAATASLRSSLPRVACRATPVRAFSSTPAFRDIKTRYTAEHEWVTLDTDSNIGTVGITDYAQKALGDVVYVELPSSGSQVKQGDQMGTVESVKAASDIYAPVAGTIEKVNERLADESNLLNKSPEKDGWLCQIRLSSPGEFETLLEKDAYQKLTDESG